MGTQDYSGLVMMMRVPMATSPSLHFLVFICNPASSVTDMVCTVSGMWQKRWRVTPEERL